MNGQRGEGPFSDYRSFENTVNGGNSPSPSNRSTPSASFSNIDNAAIVQLPQQPTENVRLDRLY
jgi:hypothetical protein